MASNTMDKQKEKIILDIAVQKEKIEKSLELLKEAVIRIEKGDGDTPYWNGENAYNTISDILSFIDKSNLLLDSIDECEKSLKKYR